MKEYIGTKLICATPMSRQAYNEYRGWTLPADENGADDGYLVEYVDGGKPNHPKHDGYISWSPKAQFDAAYHPTTGMTFGLAVEALKQGLRVARLGWNGKGMWLMLIRGRAVQIHHQEFGPINEHDHEWRDRVPKLLPWIGVKTSDNGFVPWQASQSDMLADDWQIAG